ncbi:MAG: hypothetical protein V3U79_01450 [Dehalococcoidia bacterium]
MDIDDDDRIAYAMSQTEVLRVPRQNLATFGTTNVRYFLLTKPAYSDLISASDDTVIREGRVISERPRVVTPGYMLNLQGFGDNARGYFNRLIAEHGPNVPGILYHYRNEQKNLNIVSGDVLSVMDRIEKEIGEDPLVGIIRGVDELWDISLLKFIHDLTARSLEGNLRDFQGSGLVSVDSSGTTADARRSIEEMFQKVMMKAGDPNELKRELDRWGLFSEYEDRFLKLFS